MKVRNHHILNQETLQTQKEEIEFLSILSPSLKYRIMMHHYSLVLSANHHFLGHDEAVQFMLDRISIRFLQPEMPIMKQNDPDYKDIYITGMGSSEVFKQLDQFIKKHCDTLEEGTMIGAVNVIYDNKPSVTVQARNYTTIGLIGATDFKEMLLFSPDIKLDLINGIVNNPYDFDRDYFV